MIMQTVMPTGDKELQENTFYVTHFISLIAAYMTLHVWLICDAISHFRTVLLSLAVRCCWTTSCGLRLCSFPDRNRSRLES